MERHPAACERGGSRPAVIRLSDRMIPVLVAVWGLLVVVGLCALWSYGSTSGDDEMPPLAWPTASRIARDGKPTLLFFAHPLCPCSRASLAELARIEAICHDRVDTHVIFIAPREADASWRDSDLYSEARAIPGVAVQADIDRREARLFRVRTSGSCLLYGSDGKLLFHGGLTASRGHEGDNRGRSSVEALLLGDHAEVSTTPVFGCALFENETSSGEPESSAD